MTPFNRLPELCVAAFARKDLGEFMQRGKAQRPTGNQGRRSGERMPH
jgi:hypothetical protein